MDIPNVYFQFLKIQKKIENGHSQSLFLTFKKQRRMKIENVFFQFLKIQKKIDNGHSQCLF
jgi:hypothetical protein